MIYRIQIGVATKLNSRMENNIRDRVKGALWLVYVGDAMSMPAHWFYNQEDISRTFGYISEYRPAPSHHPSSIMNLASTASGGRGEQSGNIVGDVILKSKKQYWEKPNTHYHHGMRAGENTLNAQCARLLMRTITSNGGEYNSSVFLNEYVKFMTTENSHNDTYAESYHRYFFSNYNLGKPLHECAKSGSDTPSIGGFVTLPVIVMASLNDGKKVMQERVVEHLFLTHPDKGLAHHAITYCDALYDIIVEGHDPKERIKKAGNVIGFDVENACKLSETIGDFAVVKKLGLACYISSSLPNVLFLAMKYYNNPEHAILQNTNAGGENCHRGSALGALVGAANGFSKITAKLIDGLNARDDIDNEIESFLNILNIK